MIRTITIALALALAGGVAHAEGTTQCRINEKTSSIECTPTSDVAVRGEARPDPEGGEMKTVETKVVFADKRDVAEFWVSVSIPMEYVPRDEDGDINEAELLALVLFRVEEMAAGAPLTMHDPKSLEHYEGQTVEFGPVDVILSLDGVSWSLVGA
jgi:hypothetical protein